MRFGLFEADLNQRLLTKSGVRVKLQDQPFQILDLLLRRPGDVISREEIRQNLWPANTYVEFDDGLNTAIKKLRCALGETADNPRFIETIPRRGYRFIAPISIAGVAIEEDGVASLPQPSLLLASHERSRITIETSTRWPSPVVWVLATFFISAATYGIGRYLYNSHQSLTKNIKTESTAPAVLVKSRPSVAILQFRNLTGRADLMWLSTAITEMLNTELAAGRQVRMVPGEQVARVSRQFASDSAMTLDSDSLARLHSSLGSDYVALGSYMVLGNGSRRTVRVDLRLQDARIGEAVDEYSFSGSQSRLFDLIAEAGSRIRQRIGVAQPTEEQQARVIASLPKNPEAARSYSEGLEKLRVFDAMAARGLLQKAIAYDSGHALSHSALAEAWSALGYDKKAGEEAKKAFDLSAALSREDRLATEARYQLLKHDYRAAEEIYRSLLASFPDDLDYGLELVRAQTKGGNPKDALITLAALRKLPAPQGEDPRIDLAEAFARETLSDFRSSRAAAAAAFAKARAHDDVLLMIDARSREAWALNCLGEIDNSVAAYQDALELAKKDGNLRDTARLLHSIAQTQHDKGDFVASAQSFTQALAQFRKIGAMWDVASCSHNLGILLMDQGQLRKAKERFEEALRIQRSLEDERGVASDLDDLGNALMSLGELDQAILPKTEALQSFRHIGNRMGEAITLSNLADVLAAKGDLQGAARNFEQSLAIKKDIGFKSGIGYALSEQAGLLLVQDRMREADDLARQALAIRQETNNQAYIAQSQLQIAEIQFQEGKTTTAETLAKNAADAFEKQRSSAGAAQAFALLTRILLSEGRGQEAKAYSDRAVVLSRQTGDLMLRFNASLAAVDVLRESGKRIEALKTLENLRDDAHRHGHLGFELEARLGLAEIEWTSGRSVTGKAALQQVSKEARDHGFLLIARQADAALHSPASSVAELSGIRLPQ